MKNYTAIAKKIISLTEKDQKMRKKWAESGFNHSKYDSTVDIENKEKIEALINEVGWPTASMIGGKASDCLWVLIQHAGFDILFQKKMLALMKNVPRGEIDQKHIAKLEDRILIAEGKPQIYGTSFKIDLKTKKLSVDPIEDIENIDKRRLKMGMDSFEAQKKRAFDGYKKFKMGDGK